MNSEEKGGCPSTNFNEQEGKSTTSWYITWAVKYWWVTPLLFGLHSFLLFETIQHLTSTWVEEAAFDIWLLFVPICITKAIILLWKRKWLKCIGLALTMVAISVVAVPCVFFAALFAPHNDDFAKEHPIPEGIEYNIPMEYQDYLQICDSIESSNENVRVPANRNDYLQIWNGFQGGIYLYDFYYPALPAGTVYLKCYEVGKNEQLSESRLTESSSVEHPATTSFSKIVEKQEFTIYEGDWDEYYAVRVEVWHHDKKTDKDRKLLEKIYRMEGWMR